MRIPLSGVELRPSIVDDLVALLSPAARDKAEQAIPILERQISEAGSDVRGIYESDLAHARSILNSAQPVRWQRWSVTSSDGVEYDRPLNFSSYGPPPIGSLENSTTAAFELHVDSVNRHSEDEHGIEVFLSNGHGWMIVTAPDEHVRDLAVAAQQTLQDYEVPTLRTESDHFRVFIAYGGGRMWEIVRDYLRDAGFRVDAFVEEERAGQTTIDVVSGMIHSASLAVIVMTRADEVAGRWQARQNVIHELGLAQGVLGLQRTILLREDGVSLPSNLDGVNYIEFDRGEVHTTRERVVNIARTVRADLEAGFTGRP